MKLLALHAHPDDESSKGAATVAKYAHSGVACVLVCATGGEAGDILNPALDRPDVRDDLPRVRRAELAAAAKIIGYREVHELGYRDSGMAGSVDNEDPRALINAPFEDVLGRVIEIVRSERPDVVIGYDDHRRYPHPDHLLVHRLSVAITEAAADPGRFPATGKPFRIPRLFAPVFTKRKTLAMHEALLERGLASPFADRIATLGQTEDEGSLWRIDVTGYVERGREALRAHATQVEPDGFWFAVPTDLVEEVYPYEDFEALGGFDLPARDTGELLDLTLLRND